MAEALRAVLHFFQTHSLLAVIIIGWTVVGVSAIVKRADRAARDAAAQQRYEHLMRDEGQAP